MNEAAENDPPSLDILRHFNQNLPHDTRIIPITLPIGDGLTLLLKKIKRHNLMKTLSRSLFLLPLTLLAASCAVSHPHQPADNANFVLPDIPREPLPEKKYSLSALGRTNPD